MAFRWPNIWIMLERACVTQCTLPSTLGQESPNEQLAPETLRDIVQCAEKEHIPLLLLAGPLTAADHRYVKAVQNTEHTWLVPATHELPDDERYVPVIPQDAASQPFSHQGVVTVKYNFSDAAKLPETLARLAEKGLKRVNLAMEDLMTLEEKDIAQYRELLLDLAYFVTESLVKGKAMEVDVLTDRLVLDRMNNCSAGESHITVGPDGLVYACPAFYWAQGQSFDCIRPEDFCYGSFAGSHEIAEKKNIGLLHFRRAPICQACDAYQCNRCVYMGWRKTLEACVPSRIQCLVATAERNASQALLQMLEDNGIEFKGTTPIPPLKYDDPFDYCKTSGFPAPGHVRRPAQPAQNEATAPPTAARSGNGIHRELRELKDQVRQITRRIAELEKTVSSPASNHDDKGHRISQGDKR